MPIRRLVVLAVLAAIITGCSGSSGGSSAKLPAKTPPDLASFLALPAATPSSCPSDVSGSTVGRSSPWVGHVDMSVFVSTSATARETRKVGNALSTNPIVRTVYFESKAEAFQEFKRLYSCWTSVPRSQTPASFRVVLSPIATIGSRNALVARTVRLPHVDTVSCDPSEPCVNVVESASAAPAGGAMR
jgi:hypothetical protein